MSAVLTVLGLSKTFAGTRALDNVDFDVCGGEVHALVGQNGSGKSTLIKVLSGFHEPDPGVSVELDGRPLALHDPAASRAAGLRFVHQDLGLVGTLDTAENLALGGGFDTAFGGRIRWRAARRDARERMRALGYGFDVRRPVSELAAAERTGIAIARALQDWEQARVLVLDEPTAALPRHEVAVLFEAVRRVRTSGLGVIYVSHRLDEVFEIGDRVTVLRDGRRVTTTRTSELDEERLVSLMLGGETLKPARNRGAAGDVVLAAEGICGLLVDNVNLTVRAGEVIGIAGLTGSGREEILPLLFGAASRHGTVAVRGRTVGRGPAGAKRAGIALVPANRHTNGSITSLTVRENCTLTDLRRHSRGPAMLTRKRERAEVEDWIDKFDVRPRRTEELFAALSGGNQQKVVVAKWLRMKPSVLLLDEPTQGIDVHAKATLHALARDVAAGGSAVVIASSDDAELCDTCDRILVMRDGVIVGEVGGEGSTPEQIARMQLGGTSAASAVLLA